MRYIGITTSTDDQYPQVLEALGKLKLDFLQVDYSIDNRGSEERILPLAKEKGVAVLTNLPLGGRRGSVLTKAGGQAVAGLGCRLRCDQLGAAVLEVQHLAPGGDRGDPGHDQDHAPEGQPAGRSRSSAGCGGSRTIEELWATLSA